MRFVPTVRGASVPRQAGRAADDGRKSVMRDGASRLLMRRNDSVFFSNYIEHNFQYGTKKKSCC